MSRPTTRRARLWGAVAAVAAVAAFQPAVAGADATGSVNVPSSTMIQGGTMTATIDITYGTGIITELSFFIGGMPGSTGSVTATLGTPSGAIHACVQDDAITVSCLWNETADPQTGSLTLQLDASADATGTFRLGAYEHWAPAVNGQISVIAIDTADIVVQAPVTTEPPTSTGTGGGTPLPETGGNAGVVWAAMAAVLLGGVAAIAARRNRTAPTH